MLVLMRYSAGWMNVPMEEDSQIGCFDTAFHQSLEATVSRIALPRKYEAEGVRRYGFHGLSYEHIATRLREISPKLAGKRTVVAHLGNGASVASS